MLFFWSIAYKRTDFVEPLTRNVVLIKHWWTNKWLISKYLVRLARNILKETVVCARTPKFHVDSTTEVPLSKHRSQHHICQIAWADSQLKQESVEITTKKTLTRPEIKV